MIKTTLLLIAENMITSQEKNLPSYFNCFDTINATKFPFTFPMLFLCGQWRKTVPEQLNLFMEITIKSPDGKDIVTPLKDEVIFKQENHRINVLFQGLRFESSGEYSCKVQMYNHKRESICVAEKALYVRQVAPAPSMAQK